MKIMKMTLCFALVMATGCATNAVRLSDETLSGDPDAMWTDGQRMTTRGEAMVERGEKRLEDGRDQVREGEAMVAKGGGTMEEMGQILGQLYGQVFAEAGTGRPPSPGLRRVGQPSIALRLTERDPSERDRCVDIRLSNIYGRSTPADG